jgi:hypothetical protein
VTSVNGQTGDVVLDLLPSQTGQSGKFLTTDGTDASWATINALQNTATGANSVGIVGTASGSKSVVLGETTNDNGAGANVLIGYGAKANNWTASYAISIGFSTKVGSEDAIAIGDSAESTAKRAVSIGHYAKATAQYAIQIGGTAATNSDANTFKVANANGNFEMMSANGTIPSDRLPNAINKYSTMPTAVSTNEGWIVQFTGATDSTYTHGYIYECKAQGTSPETYAWEAVEVQAGGSSLPSQTGNSGKFLTTDGTDASWSDTPLVNTATGVNSCVVKRGTGTVSGNVATVLNSDFGTQNNTNVGFVSIGSSHTNFSSRPGNSSTSIRGGIANGSYSVAIGEGKATGQYSTVINATNCSGTGDFSISVGTNCMASALNSIQIGHAANLTTGTNSDANTFKVANANGNFELMSADGTIPEARLADTTNAQQGDVLTLDSNGNAVWQAGGGGGGSTALSLTLAAANWSNNTITVTATGVTASNNVIVSPAPASQSAYTTAGVMCTAQASDSLTFTCTTTPSSDLTVTVLII